MYLIWFIRFTSTLCYTSKFSKINIFYRQIYKVLLKNHCYTTTILASLACLWILPRSLYIYSFACDLTGEAKMVFPGLTQPISIPRDSPKDRTKYTFPKMYELEDIPEEKEGTKLKREYPKDTPEERGYTGKSLAGKKRGPPAPVDGCKSQWLCCCTPTTKCGGGLYWIRFVASVGPSVRLYKPYTNDYSYNGRISFKLS